MWRLLKVAFHTTAWWEAQCSTKENGKDDLKCAAVIYWTHTPLMHALLNGKRLRCSYFVACWPVVGMRLFHFCLGAETTLHTVWLFLHVTFNFIYSVIKLEKALLRRRSTFWKRKWAKYFKKTASQRNRKQRNTIHHGGNSKLAHFYTNISTKDIQKALCLLWATASAVVCGQTCPRALYGGRLNVRIVTDHGETSLHRLHLPSPTKSNKRLRAVNARGNYSNTRFWVRLENKCVPCGKF